MQTSTNTRSLLIVSVACVAGVLLRASLVPLAARFDRVETNTAVSSVHALREGVFLATTPHVSVDVAKCASPFGLTTVTKTGVAYLGFGDFASAAVDCLALVVDTA
jgi:hypothetical protein